MNSISPPWQLVSTTSWWLWIISGILSQTSVRLSIGAEDLESTLTASYATMASYATEILLSILAMLVVRAIYDRQDDKFHTSPPQQSQDRPDMPMHGNLAA